MTKRVRQQTISRPRHWSATKESGTRGPLIEPAKSDGFDSRHGEQKSRSSPFNASAVATKCDLITISKPRRRNAVRLFTRVSAGMSPSSWLPGPGTSDFGFRAGAETSTDLCSTATETDMRRETHPPRVT
jgi:hypothetical protein